MRAKTDKANCEVLTAASHYYALVIGIDEYQDYRVVDLMLARKWNFTDAIPRWDSIRFNRKRGGGG
ncbi:MAG: hypothetical protein DRR19_26680 [Candidatus Parabeggiatoa sp. nov. 1]|nr:MAG: hypothetical protein DRR19_26680 [Gammaproteobacteria bacterium]